MSRFYSCNVNLPRLQWPRRAAFLLTLAAATLALFPATSDAQTDSPCHDPYRWCTLYAGGGWTGAEGKDGGSFKSGWNFAAGAGLDVTRRPSPQRKWSLFIDVNFLFDRMNVSQTALQQAVALNPTNVGLLQASSAQGTFLNTSLDPTLLFPVGEKVDIYVFGGFGWFRRTLSFSGGSAEGALLQPGSPTVFGSGGNSGAVDGGAGIDHRPRKSGLAIYAEIKVVHGLAVNQSTTLVPISAGIRW